MNAFMMRLLDEAQNAVIAAALAWHNDPDFADANEDALDAACEALLKLRRAAGLCIGCGMPFVPLDHDPRCSSCAESGTGPEPRRNDRAGTSR